MGQMRLVIPRPERLVPQAVEQAYLAGLEGIPWECKTTAAGNSVIIERDTKESGYLYFPWNVAGHGTVMLVSGSLMERPKPYHLPVELARGTLNRLRNQSCQWQAAGMTLSQQFSLLLRQANTAFSLSATGQDDPLEAEEHAERAISIGLEAADLLAGEYTRQVLAIRRAQHAPLGTLLAARLEGVPAGDLADKFLEAFNSAIIAPPWHEVQPQHGKYDWTLLDAQMEWCRAHNLRIICGPLMQFDRHLLPDWLFLDDEFEDVQASAVEFVNAVVTRYRSKVHLWIAAARMNQDGAFDYSEEQRLRLVVDSVDRVRYLDARTPLIVSFDQPWAEYIARKDQELTPLHFADTLVRGELGLAGIGLEINYGYWPGGTLPRDPLEFSRQIDRWSQLGVPLVLFFTAPSSASADPLAKQVGRTIPNLAPSLKPKWQRKLVESLLPLMLAKQSVQAFAWNQFQDDMPHGYPHGGLVDARGQPKLALQTIAQLRKEMLG